ncbi:MAG: carboxypeptidase regulatory-like domain-containing protein, partial [Chitinophagaceae bacterium]|nr:carboxypeptidase regulatory-like domain-containing protein [Chitinophagaceae bacterium]
MRIFVLTILLTINGVLIAGRSAGQELDKIYVSLDLRNASLKTALRTIESVSKVPFTYRNAEIAPYDSINLHVEKMALSKVLQMVLNNTGLRYELVNSNIIIKKVKDYSPPLIPAMDVHGLAIVFNGGVRGRVTGAQGQPIANASIMVEPGVKGAAANQNGEFSITGLKAGT